MDEGRGEPAVEQPGGEPAHDGPVEPDAAAAAASEDPPAGGEEEEQRRAAIALQARARRVCARRGVQEGGGEALCDERDERNESAASAASAAAPRPDAAAPRPDLAEGAQEPRQEEADEAPGEAEAADEEGGRFALPAAAALRQKCGDALDVPPKLRRGALPPEQEQQNNKLVRPFRDMIAKKGMLLIVISVALFLITVTQG